MNNAPPTGNFQLDNECNACAGVTSPLEGEARKSARNVSSWNVGSDDVKHRKAKPPKAFVV
jgi:hypothetical protein